ncbi:glutaredoxin domain-containing protein [Actinoplanes xinjiangensis]|uniref:glutaredoxin domain-containing protein n=1 Tax=Actinoplanes xinjiangensis TaxID=512350 RepID=UPI003441467A
MSQADVIVYSRPGCPYCYLLRRGLRRRGVAFTELDIWQHADAAAAVRAVAGGNETVPTVHVAGRWLINPRAARVQSLATGQ